MKIIDAHCDALYKLNKDKSLRFNKPSEDLDVHFEHMMKSDIILQFFAIYLPETVKNPTIEHVLELIDIFYQQVYKGCNVSIIKNKGDFQKLMAGNGRGAILSLEGADALKGDPVLLRTLFYLGVRFIGITWNYGNWAADGILEPRKGGFSRAGKSFIKDCNELGIILDVSHLSEQGFWELAELSSAPFIASHSNSLSRCNHPRNLNDDQIKAIIQTNGAIGITFVPWFVDKGSPVPIASILKHMDHICALGGERHIGFGSDFDGIEQWITGLEHAGKYEALVEELLRHYKSEEVERFMWKNWERFLEINLPD
jgi:membrane dipeptidase